LINVVDWLKLATQQLIAMNQTEDVELSRDWSNRNTELEPIEEVSKVIFCDVC